MPFLLFTLACTPPVDQPGGAETGPAETSDSAAACEGEVSPTVETTDMPTVLRVRWETEQESEGQVRFSGTGQVSRITRAASGTQHEALLVGLRPSTEVAFTVLVDGVPACGGSGTALTGAFGASLPPAAVALSTPDAADAGLTAVTVITGATAAATLLDESGVVVWAAVMPGSGRVPYRVLPSLDGEWVLYNESAGGELPGMLYRVPLDGSTGDAYPVPGGHTDFVETEPGAYAMLGWDVQVVEGRTLVGDTIVEFDAAGVSRTVWSTFDSITPDLTRQYDKGWYPGNAEAEDWTHVNALSYDADEGAYYVSITLDDSVARVDRASGEMTWRMGNPGGDFRSEAGERLFARPHSVQRIGDDVIVFNRHSVIEGTPDCGNAVRVSFDEAAGTAERVWSYEPDTCVPVEWLGSAQRLPAGSTVVSFSSAGRLDEVAADGTPMLSLQLPAGGQYGFATRVLDAGGSFPDVE